MLKIAELTIQVRVSLVGGDGAGPDYGRAGHKDLIDEEHPHEHGGKAEGPYRSCDSHSCEAATRGRGVTIAIGRTPLN